MWLRLWTLRQGDFSGLCAKLVTSCKLLTVEEGTEVKWEQECPTWGVLDCSAGSKMEKRVIVVNYQVKRLWALPGDKHLATPLGNYLDCFNWSGKAVHSGQYHSLGCNPGPYMLPTMDVMWLAALGSCYLSFPALTGWMYLELWDRINFLH